MQLPKAYLTDRVTLEQVLAEYDFGSCNAEFRADWERLLSKRAAGDEFWRFAPPPGHLEVWGIALVRDGKVISTLVDSVG
ncbi:MAG: hypothetical protein ACM3U2_12605 [Deltaproteobacteria bacterium]